MTRSLVYGMPGVSTMHVSCVMRRTCCIRVACIARRPSLSGKETLKIPVFAPSISRFSPARLFESTCNPLPHGRAENLWGGWRMIAVALTLALYEIDTRYIQFNYISMCEYNTALE